MKRVAVTLGSAVICFIVVVAALALSDRNSGSRGESRLSADTYRGSEPPARLHMPAFALRDYTGALVRSQDLRGKVVLLTFLDSQCTDACPVIARQIALTFGRLDAEERKRVVPVAISVDPAEDTPRSIRSFLGRQRAIGKLRYLVGSEHGLRRLWKQFGILSSLESGKDTLHSAPVRLYDGTGTWVATQHAGADLTPANLAHDIRAALTAAS